LVFKTVVPRSVALAEAPAQGCPGIIVDGRSAGAQAYLRLAAELLSRVKKRGPAERKKVASHIGETAA